MDWLNGRTVNIYKIGDTTPGTYLVRGQVKHVDPIGVAIQEKGSKELACYTWATLSGYHIKTLDN